MWRVGYVLGGGRKILIDGNLFASNAPTPDSVLEGPAS